MVLGTPLPLKGTVTVGSADNPARHLLGGSRMVLQLFECAVTAWLLVLLCAPRYDGIITMQFRDSDFQLRTPSLRESHPAEIEGDDAYLREHNRTTYGVNCPPALNELQHFNVSIRK